MKTLFDLWIGEYGELPSSYLVWDIETSDTSVLCRIVQIAALVVRDNRPETVHSFFIKHPPGTMTKGASEVTGITDEMLAERGLPEEEVLPRMLAFFESWNKQHLPFVGHNVLKFDEPRFINRVDRLVPNLEFSFPANRVLDTGAAVKSMGLPPEIARSVPGEGIGQYSMRILRFWDPSRKIKSPKWSLGKYCIETFQLDKKYGFNRREMHMADMDCLVTHYLLQELKKAHEKTSST